MNFGLNLFFNRIVIGDFVIKPHFYYTRENYDAIAKNEDIGFSLSSSFYEFGLFANFGYRNFYSVSQYYISHYINNWFFDIGLSVKNKYYLQYSYDAVRLHQITFVFDIKDIFSALIGGGLTIKESSEYLHEGAASGSIGLRYRHPRGGFR